MTLNCWAILFESSLLLITSRIYRFALMFEDCILLRAMELAEHRVLCLKRICGDSLDFLINSSRALDEFNLNHIIY